MRFLFILCFLFSLNTFSQDDIVVREYFKNGEFEKALISYKKLYSKNKKNRNYLIQLVKTHQQLEQYNEAENLLITYLNTVNYPPALIELGYNYKLQKDTINANINYQKALDIIDLKPNYAGIIGRGFENFSLLDKAIQTYEKAMAIKPELNFNMQLARIYGEQGDVEKMFNSYINFSEINESYINTIKREFSTFISENKENENNTVLRKILLKKIQTSRNLKWNDMLSWLFIQQKDYKKAFTQEKAIYKRQLESLDRVEELANIAYTQKQPEVAKTIFQFIIDNTQDIDIKINAHYNLIKIETEQVSTKDYKTINESYLSLLETFGKEGRTLNIQIAYAHFLAFYLNKTSEAILFLKDSLKLDIDKHQLSQIKIELGDILVLEEKFNEALIYYTQIQRSLKNSTISQEARFKVAKTSYYKGDFKWAESQLKILKASTSQLTANDALDLKLLISDNKAEDSLQIALKLYAKADLLAFQNKKDESIAFLNTILKEHKTEPIVAQTLLKQAQLFKETEQFEKAKVNYERIIKDFKEGILIDDAIYALAEIYTNKLVQPEKAKALYESIIFNHADSIYFVESRKKYRALRGDAIN
ncbi:tetratricopeptide repeat protein [Lacinutrix jangbogonensis]|uniref:tetratricopeptide repeat protein n=1 Tax=Lacinutrix jangbogonensis TaxID=1469557 RepID=UPI00053DA6D3|nr:tetratricopeptide repeat protein [Lacinutrix jangbogonensis]